MYEYSTRVFHIMYLFVFKTQSFFIIVHRSGGEETLLHLAQPADCPPLTQRVLAACHNLVLIDHELIGDPLEKAALSSVGWSLTRSTHMYRSHILVRCVRL